MVGGCSVTACAAWKLRLLKKELDGKETSPVPKIGEMKELHEDVLNADSQKYGRWEWRPTGPTVLMWMC